MDGWLPRYAVVDVETTGFSPRTDEVVEIAVVQIDDDRIVGQWSSLVRPSISIPYRATEVHGICDRDVASAPRLRHLLPRIEALCERRVVAAHYKQFDLSFLPFLAMHPQVCTLQLARQAFPNAPSHKNQALREYLGLDADPSVAALGRHRALADALVSAHVLIRCRRRLSRSFAESA